MTCIVWDGKSLAADSRVTMGTQLIQDNAIKIMQPAGKFRDEQVLCIGVAGGASSMVPLADWIEEGADYTTFAQKVGEWRIEAFIVTESKCWILSGDEKPFPITSPIAVGSGSLPAIAAMKLGKTAKEACEFAITMDVHCGGKVNVVKCRDENGAPLNLSEGLPSMEEFTVEKE